MGRKAYIPVKETKEPKVLTEVVVRLYEPDNDLPVTHRPEVTFTGELISMHMCDTINMHMRKALRRFKINTANLNKESEVAT